MRQGLQLRTDPCMVFLCRMGPRDSYTFDKLKRRLVFVLMTILTRLTNSPRASRARGPGGRCSVILMVSSFTLSLFSICETRSGYNYTQFKGIVLAPARTNVCKIYIDGQLGAFITGLSPFNRILLWILQFFTPGAGPHHGTAYVFLRSQMWELRVTSIFMLMD